MAEVIDVTNDPTRLTSETAVCREHFDRMQAGEAWTYHHEDSSIYMGDDLKAEGIRLVSEFSGNEASGRLHGIEGVRPTSPVFKFVTTFLDGSPAETVELLLTPVQITRLREMLQFYDRS